MSESDDDVMTYPQENSDESESDEDELKRKTIRENLSTLSFEELIKLKEKLGAKIYNETVLGASQSKKQAKKEVKRVNKNRPREISSKIRPKQIRAILSKSSTFAAPKPKTYNPRDPRFDPYCGDFDKASFKKNYEFVDDIRQDEKIQLQKEYEECTDPHRKKTIKLLLQRTENQLREEEKMNKEKRKDESEKKEIRQQIKQGEKPVYKKKSVKSLESLVEKYEELKKTNRLEKHIQKRAKKLKVKDRKSMEKIK